MNRFMQIVALIALAAPASAIEVTTTPGQLSSQIEDTSVTTLTITGEMDARDFHYISSELTQLTSLDLSGVTIASYSDVNHPLSPTVSQYDAGTLPQAMLMGMKLENLVLPESLSAIGQAALAGCDHLTSITIPASVTTIGDYAFSGTALQNITIPATVQTVGRWAFAHCFDLTQATVDAAIIGDQAFLGDIQLQNLQLGAGVKRIGTEAFHGTAIQALDATAATALDSLGSWALASTPLATLSLPASMTQMGEGAFFGTTSLAAASLPTGLQQVPAYAFAGGSQILTDSLLHEGVTAIGDYAFYNWDATRYFFIPSTVNHLGTRAMAGMIGLEQIDVAASIVPSLGELVWDGVNQPTVKLGTPNNDTAELYAAAEQWQDFYILHDYLLGDVNGDGFVDVADINLVVNKMLGENPSPFIVPAADIDNGGIIDVSDVNDIVNIILGLAESTTVRRIQGKNGPSRPTTDDMVTIEPFSIRPGETRTLQLYLANSQDYEAMQLDITLPAGLELANNKAGSTSRTMQHTQSMRTFGDLSRLVSVSLQGKPFAQSDDALVTISVRATDELAPGAAITLTNVLLAQGGTCYMAPDTATPVSNTTGVDNLNADSNRAYAVGSTLVIEASEATTVQVVSLNGMVRTLDVPAGHSEWNDLPAGVYIVRLQANSYKVALN
ncbi:MAG: leucine-rich repeat protein [Muribaculaceae bacterium]|nr:leucine-rich repeat protein [Muribaculaceae bacterium]